MIVDGNLRRKDQTIFSTLFGFDTSDIRDAHHRLADAAREHRHPIVRRADEDRPPASTITIPALEAKRSVALSDPPFHTYDLKQQSAAIYWQQTVGVLPTTDVSFGARLQQTRLSARDRYDPTAPGGAFDAQATPLDSVETQHALHLGFEHRFSPMFAVFGRVARSFRTPNVDERIGVNAFPVDFNLKTQTSRDIEGGVRGRFGGSNGNRASMRCSSTTKSCSFRFRRSAPISISIRRAAFGVENSATLRLSDTLRLKGGLTYTRATFREGIVCRQ